MEAGISEKEDGGAGSTEAQGRKGNRRRRRQQQQQLVAVRDFAVWLWMLLPACYLLFLVPANAESPSATRNLNWCSTDGAYCFTRITIRFTEFSGRSQVELVSTQVLPLTHLGSMKSERSCVDLKRSFSLNQGQSSQPIPGSGSNFIQGNEQDGETKYQGENRERGQENRKEEAKKGKSASGRLDALSAAGRERDEE